MIAQKSLRRKGRSRLAPAPRLLPICCFVTIFRSADPASSDYTLRQQSRFRQHDVGFIAFLYDTVTLPQTQYPLCFHALVYCLPDSDRPGGTSFLKRGGGGSRPESYQQDYAALISELLGSIRDFPRGWIEDVPPDIS